MAAPATSRRPTPAGVLDFRVSLSHGSLPWLGQADQGGFKTPWSAADFQTRCGIATTFGCGSTMRAICAASASAACFFSVEVFVLVVGTAHAADDVAEHPLPRVLVDDGAAPAVCAPCASDRGSSSR